MAEVFRPAVEWELQSLIRRFAEARTPLEIVGGGSKRAMGRPSEAAVRLETGSLAGISLYEPTELVMSARAGTPLAQIETTLADRGQMLAFEPMDLGPATGGPGGAQTIGGVVAVNISGPRRIASGAARDHVLGVRAVNGRAEVFKSGGRVLKNVTGYDVARALAGSWGTLAILTEVTFKVLPRPKETATLVYQGLSDELATELMCAAMSTPYEVSGTMHLTAGLAKRLEHQALAREGTSLTAVRLENFATSLRYRAPRLAEALKVFGSPMLLDNDPSLRLWEELRRLSVMTPAPGEPATQLWRLSTSPGLSAKLVDQIRRNVALEALYDASGGIVWLEVAASADGGAADIRRLLASYGGHATLVRAGADVRRAVDVFHPMSSTIERLNRGLKEAFDPLGLLNPGRMYADV